MRVMRWSCLALALALVLAAAACRRHDYRTVTITVPEMKNAACVAVVERALGGVQGLLPDRTNFDLSTRNVTVTYDSLLLSLKNIEFAIAEAGFRANDVPADGRAAAALPAACR